MVNKKQIDGRPPAKAPDLEHIINNYPGVVQLIEKGCKSENKAFYIFVPIQYDGWICEVGLMVDNSTEDLKFSDYTFEFIKPAPPQSEQMPIYSE